jgi:hypothetical protein
MIRTASLDAQAIYAMDLKLVNKQGGSYTALEAEKVRAQDIALSRLSKYAKEPLYLGCSHVLESFCLFYCLL